MKSDVDIKDDIYNVVSCSKLKDSINGRITKSKRPHGSIREDVVISIIANLTQQRQEAQVNVNIYTKGQRILGQNEEDDQRLRELCQTAFDVIEGVRKEDFHLELLEQRVYEVEAKDEYVINNKLLYKIINE